MLNAIPVRNMFTGFETKNISGMFNETRLYSNSPRFAARMVSDCIKTADSIPPYKLMFTCFQSAKSIKRRTLARKLNSHGFISKSP